MYRGNRRGGGRVQCRECCLAKGSSFHEGGGVPATSGGQICESGRIGLALAPRGGVRAGGGDAAPGVRPRSES